MVTLQWLCREPLFFWQVLKSCLRGKKTLGSVCPISGFPVFSPAMREETHLRSLQPCSQAGFLSWALPWGLFGSRAVRELLQWLFGGRRAPGEGWRREHGNSDSWRGLQAAAFGLVFVQLFLFNWLRKANTLSSVSVGDVCAWNSEHPQSGAPAGKWSTLPNTGDFWSRRVCWFYCWVCWAAVGVWVGRNKRSNLQREKLAGMPAGIFSSFLYYIHGIVLCHLFLLSVCFRCLWQKEMF